MLQPRWIHATCLTTPAPSANYRGESEENRTVLQKLTVGGTPRLVVSPEAIRNALREQLAAAGLPCNRRRLPNEEQLAVGFEGLPNAGKYADDFIFGYMVADPPKEMKKEGLPGKRDSLLQVNLGVSITPYADDVLLHQSPLHKEGPVKNADSSALLLQEIGFTAFAWLFSLPLLEGRPEGPAPWPALQRGWLQTLLKSIGELHSVAGNHARTRYEFAPRSLVLRLGPRPVFDVSSYGWQEDGTFPELSRIRSDDLPGSEFWLGGALVRDLQPAERARLEAEGVHLSPNPQRLLEEVAAVGLS